MDVPYGPYTYNAIGNIMTKTVGSDTFTYTYNATKKHAVANINANGTDYAFTYDNTGNMRTGYDLSDTSVTPPSRDMYYNVENMPWRILHIDGSTTVDTRFYYDGELGRVRKYTIGVGNTYYYGDHFERINGTLTKYIFVNNLRIARIQGSTKIYFHKDHLDSSSAITSNSGAVLESSKFMPFGQLRESTGASQSDYKYTDQEQDTSTNLYNYNARLYDPAIGLFTTPDPYFSPNLASHEHYSKVVANSTFEMEFLGEFEKHEFAEYFTNPQRLNRFAYVQNNPIKFNDPLGLFADIYDMILVNAQEQGVCPTTSITYHSVSVTGVAAFSYHTVELHSAENGFDGYEKNGAEHGICSTMYGGSTDIAFSFVDHGGETEGMDPLAFTYGAGKCLGVTLDVVRGLIVFHIGTPSGVPMDVAVPINPEQPIDWDAQVTSQDDLTSGASEVDSSE